MTPDPWAEIAAAASAAVFSGRRVAPEHPYDFFWGRDVSGRRLLVLLYDGEEAVDDPRPKLNGIEIIEPETRQGDRAAFILALKQDDATEIFAQLCHDIILAAANCATDAAALSATIRRAWKWHSLLRSGGSARLSEAEQIGLLGELLMLRQLIGRYGAAAALSFWRGPLDEPKDFRISASAIEVKTRQGGRHGIEITSAHQLDPSGLAHLILAVTHLAPAAPSVAGALSLDGLVAEVRDRLSAVPAVTEQFDALLTAAGWSDAEDYGAPFWLSLGTEYFDATGDFPRIAASRLALGIDQVRYRLSLDACAAYAIDDATVADWLEER